MSILSLFKHKTSTNQQVKLTETNKKELKYLINHLDKLDQKPNTNINGELDPKINLFYKALLNHYGYLTIKQVLYLLEHSGPALKHYLYVGVDPETGTEYFLYKSNPGIGSDSQSLVITPRFENGQPKINSIWQKQHENKN